MSAIKVFELFKGNWEIREVEENLKARTFWIKVIDNYNLTSISIILTDEIKD
jgi:predicted acetyltransferase